MAKARKASVTQSKIGMILYGEPFTGKSTMAMQFAYFKRPDGKPFRVLYLDPETGSIDDLKVKLIPGTFDTISSGNINSGNILETIADIPTNIRTA